jgi:hypothetical protein
LVQALTQLLLPLTHLIPAYRATLIDAAGLTAVSFPITAVVAMTVVFSSP